MNPLIYQVYPRSFRDSNGDGVGDLKGILEKVDYIASLGCDYVWISPFFKSPMKDYGYDVSDYRAVDPVFGSNKDFEALVRALKKRGIKVMVDFVAAHTSDEHPWFRESRLSRDNPKADWYVWADPRPDGTPPNNWISVFGGPAWRWEPGRGQYYLHQFLREQPSLNPYHPAVRQELLDTMEYWLKKGVRGFRLDAIQHAHHDPRLRDNPAAPGARKARASNIYDYQKALYSTGRDEGLPIIRDMRKLADKYPGTLLLGEIMQRDLARKYTGPGLLHCCYFGELVGLLQLDGKSLAKMLAAVFADFPQGDFCWAMDCHDNWRHMTRLAPDARHHDAFAVMTAALFLLMPGAYSLYQGEELGLPSASLAFDDLVDPFDRSLYPHHNGRDSARTPMPWTKKERHAGFSSAKTTWLKADPRHAARAVAEQEKNPSSVLHQIRKIVAWRKSNLTEKTRYTSLGCTDGIFRYQLKTGKKAHTLFFNLTPGKKILAVEKGLEIDKISAASARGKETVTLPPYGFAVCQ